MAGEYTEGGDWQKAFNAKFCNFPTKFKREFRVSALGDEKFMQGEGKAYVEVGSDKRKGQSLQEFYAELDSIAVSVLKGEKLDQFINLVDAYPDLDPNSGRIFVDLTDLVWEACLKAGYSVEDLRP